MKKIYLKIFRNLWQMKLHVLAIILSVSCGVFITSGVDMAIKSLYLTRDTLLKRLNFADLEINFLPEDVQNIPVLAKDNKDIKIERRLVLPGSISINKKKIKGVMLLLENPKPQINQLELIHGRYFNPDEPDEVVIEVGFSKYHKIQVGDQIDIRVGEKIYSNKVVGIVQSPEFFMVSNNPEYTVPERGSLGILFGSLSRIEKNLGFTMVNDIIFKLRDETFKKDNIKKILYSLSSLRIEKIIYPPNHIAYKHLQIDMQFFKLFAPAIVIVLCVLSFIITLINFNRLIIRERKEIGAVMAMGYSYSQVLKSYLFGGFIIAILGSTIGIFISQWFRDTFTSVYASSHGINHVENHFFFDSMLYGVAFGFLTVGLAVFIPATYYLRKSSIQDIIRPKINKIGYLIPLFKNLPLHIRWSIRNLSRRRVILFFNILAIALTIGVTISYMLTKSSLQQTIFNRFDSQKWDMVVDFLYPVYFEDYLNLKEIDGIKEIEPFLRAYVQVIGENNEKFEDSSLLGLEISSQMKNLRIIHGKKIENPDEIILSKNLVEKLNYKLNDIIKVKINEKIYQFKLSGIISDIIPNESIISINRAKEILQYTDEATGVFLKSDPLQNSFIAEELTKREFIGKVTDKSKISYAFQEIVKEIADIINIILFVSILTSLLLIFTIINLNVTERESEYAVLKSIGVDNNTIAKNILYETLIQGISAALLAIPFSIIIFYFEAHLLGKAWFEIDALFMPIDFGKAIIPMLVLIPIAVYPSIRYIFNIDITQALRTKIIE